jgi:hypothetical protein
MVIIGDVVEITVHIVIIAGAQVHPELPGKGITRPCAGGIFRPVADILIRGLRHTAGQKGLYLAEDILDLI